MKGINMQTYETRLKNLRETIQQGITDLISNYYNYQLKKYGGWNRYPSKIKKKLKKSPLGRFILQKKSRLKELEDIHV